MSSGDLPIDMEWLFNGQPINFASGIAVLRGGKRTSVLTIDSVHAGHAGNYTCKAKNKAASSEYSAALIVNGYVALVPILTPYHKLIHFEFILISFPSTTQDNAF